MDNDPKDGDKDEDSEEEAGDEQGKEDAEEGEPEEAQPRADVALRREKDDEQTAAEDEETGAECSSASRVREFGLLFALLLLP